MPRCTICKKTVNNNHIATIISCPHTTNKENRKEICKDCFYANKKDMSTIISVFNTLGLNFETSLIGNIFTIQNKNDDLPPSYAFYFKFNLKGKLIK